MNMDLYKPKLVAMLLACAVAPTSGTVIADSLTEAFSEGSVKANILLRYETVDDDTRSRDADAVTLRTRDPLAEARAFQKALVNHLLREKAPIMDGTTPEPHIPQKP